MSRFFTSSALSSMNFLRASTSSPISVVKMVSHSAMSSSRTCSRVRRSGSMVASQRCSADRRLARVLFGLLSFFFFGSAQSLAFIFVLVYIFFVFVFIRSAGCRLCRSWHALDDEGRLEILLDLLELGDELAALRGRGQRPVDDVLGALRVDEDQRPQIMFLIEARFHALQLQVFLQTLEFSFQFLDLFRRSIFVAFEIGAFG